MKIPVSFKKSEKDIYDYILTKRNYSVYIKDLVEADMKKNKSENRNNNSPGPRYINNSMEIDV